LLRYYQLHGGYTPGPAYLLALLAGIAGIFTFRRRRDPGLALACLLITGTAVAVLLGADLYEFSWRYQLSALVTLPIAGAFGVTALARQIRARRRPEAAGAVPGEAAAVSGEAAAVPGKAGAVPDELAGELTAAGSELTAARSELTAARSELTAAGSELAAAGSEQVQVP
jgi:hypothetical protein